MDDKLKLLGAAGALLLASTTLVSANPVCDSLIRGFEHGATQIDNSPESQAGFKNSFEEIKKAMPQCADALDKSKIGMEINNVPQSSGSKLNPQLRNEKAQEPQKEKFDFKSDLYDFSPGCKSLQNEIEKAIENLNTKIDKHREAEGKNLDIGKLSQYGKEMSDQMAKIKPTCTITINKEEANRVLTNQIGEVTNNIEEATKQMNNSPEYQRMMEEAKQDPNFQAIKDAFRDTTQPKSPNPNAHRTPSSPDLQNYMNGMNGSPVGQIGGALPEGRGGR